MAGSVTQSIETVPRLLDSQKGFFVVVTLDWTGDAANGTVPDTELSAAIMAQIIGLKLILGVTNPGATAPTAAYDITLEDEDGCDLFGGTMADRAAATSEQAFPVGGTIYAPRPVINDLTFKIAGQEVHSAVGTCKLVFAP